MTEIVGEKEALRRLYAALNSPWKAGPKWATYQRQTVEAALDVIKQLHDAAPLPAQQRTITDDELLDAFWPHVEVQRTGTIRGLVDGLRAVEKLVAPQP
ncbi:hypothetical protein [Chromobacterium vaccinii]|uniref:Uncharacterized protein n=1 Tax=Chromobacterium vaccinii TaxID=1108595 RepID=A0A1D9LBZ9_9NEIS|nr:hypothetical protein [Chromobacterium vaccinii]AOZ48793.1 hypothetical protein BKX93_01470 [Chromobacterium vaccinii]